jgi:CRP-like cAMP-binding protein
MAKRHGLTMPYPIATQIEYPGTVVTPEEQANQVKALLGSIPSLARLEEGSLERVVRTGQVLDYCGGETIINLGSPLSGLYFIIAGNVELSTPGPDANGHGPGGDLVLGQLSQGEFFAEQACLPTQQLSSVKVLALTDVQVFVIKRQYLQELLDQSPRLAQQIAEVMELRKRNADHLRVSRVA